MGYEMAAGGDMARPETGGELSSRLPLCYCANKERQEGTEVSEEHQ